MRVGICRDHVSRLLQRGDTVRRRNLNPVDAARTQRGKARIGLRDRHQQNRIHLRLVAWIPILVVAAERDRLARHDFGDLERARTGPARSADLAPVLAELLPLRRRRSEDVRHHPREIGRDLRGCQRDGVVVDLLPRGEDRHARTHDAGRRGLELRAVLVEDSLQVPDHGVGVEISAVVEFHAFPEVEYPGLFVVRCLLPALGKAGPQGGELVGFRKVEEDQALEDRKAEEAHALESVVRHARGGGDIRRRHGDAEGLLLCLRRRQRQQGCGGQCHG